MKRRGFLGLLGLAPAVPLIAKELSGSARPTLPEWKAPAADIWQVQPLDADKQPWQGMAPIDASFRDCDGDTSFPVVRPPSEDTRLIELTVTFPVKRGLPMPSYSRVHFMGKPVITMPTQVWGETDGDTLTIIQNVSMR